MMTLPATRSLHAAALALLLAAAATPAPVFGQANEAAARATASEVVAMVGAATAVIGGLQADINAGTAAGKVAPDALMATFQANYAKAASRPFDDKGDSAEAEARRAFGAALRETLVRFQPTMAKGGTDAFVPAFFRAELLKRFNASMKGRVQAYATNRDNELINADWSVKQVMRGSPLVAEVATLMNQGGLEAVNKRVGDRYMVYSPMRLGAACVACHARNNLQQKEGAFGGALVAEAWVK